jgi:polyketide synthase 12
VLGTVILPGTAFVELALKAGEEVGAETIEELTLQAPLVLSEEGAVSLRVSVGAADDQGIYPISIHSRAGAEGEATEWTLHATGTLVAEPLAEPEPFASWPPVGAEPLATEDLYARLADVGFEYGPAFQGLTAAWRQGDDLYAEIGLAEEQREEAARFAIHPALLDSALHGAMLGAALEGTEGKPTLPFSWSGVSVFAAGAEALRMRLRIAEEQIQLELADAENGPLARVDSLSTRPVSSEQMQGARAPEHDLFELAWRETSQSEPEEPARTILVDTRTWAGGEDPIEASHALTARALEQIQAHLAGEAPELLVVLTEGALSIAEDDTPSLPAAALAGLLRSAHSEHPGRFALIDTDGSEASAQALPDVLAALAEESLLALREGVVLAPRLTDQRGDDVLDPPAGPWRLDVTERGTLDSLSMVSAPRAEQPLGPTEVRIAMHAAGLNFRDVLNALGLYPVETSIGGEGAGVVIEVGSDVRDLAPGDRVMGMIHEAFGPVAVGERDLVVPVPATLSFEQAASLPIAFMTAFHGLVDLAGLSEGEKVLIHAGAGGVGMAAVQIAHHLGAEVFATASPSKWGALRELGIERDHIASSRDLDFKQKFLEVAGGDGLDVVLNALAGDFVDASLELLTSGGRFMEMGKTDIRDPEQIAERYPGVSYRAFDLMDAEPARLQETLVELTALFERGSMGQIPIAVWDLRRAPAAFRHLREGRNLGKVVLSVPRPLDPNRTILVTGATGGLGALFARHLAEAHGARRLLLVSRSGGDAPGAAELKEELAELGAEATIAACDVSDREQLERLIAAVPEEHPLGAVVHAAGVLDDGLVETLDAERLDRVFAPKADAAWHLHELTADLDLSAFVLFSSAAGALGGPGQGNYAAANSFLDALAARRQAAGLPATSIAWGAWGRESGMGAGLGETDVARMRRSGFVPIADPQGLSLFDAAIRALSPQALAISLDRASLRSQAGAGTLPAVFSGLVRASGARRKAGSGRLAAKLAALPEAEREGAVLEVVRAEVAAVLGHGSAATIEPESAFKDLGFDSLAAVELRNRLGAATGVRLSATAVFDYPSPAALAGHLLESTNVPAGGLRSAEMQIDQLSSALSADALGGTDRAELAARLRALAVDLEGDGRDDQLASERDRLETASDDELLAAIDDMAGKA